MDTSDILLAARDVMRDRGMARHALENADGEACLLGALNLASFGLPSLYEARDARLEIIDQRHSAWKTLGEECAERYGTSVIPDVNNEHIQDLDEACDVLEAAAKRAAEEGS